MSLKDKDALGEYNRAYYAKNRAAIRARSAAWNLANPERVVVRRKKYYERTQKVRCARSAEWYWANRDWAHARGREYNRVRRKNDPAFRLRAYLRTRIWWALKVKKDRKSAGTMALVGCSLAELIKHLEEKFADGMTWENYGPVWHVDHRRPCATFDLSDPEQQKQCFHYSNLQPLLAQDNLTKSSRWSSAA